MKDMLSRAKIFREIFEKYSLDHLVSVIVLSRQDLGEKSSRKLVTKCLTAEAVLRGKIDYLESFMPLSYQFSGKKVKCSPVLLCPICGNKIKIAVPSSKRVEYMTPTLKVCMKCYIIWEEFEGKTTQIFMDDDIFYDVIRRI